jgi:hypothetical protein
MKPPTKLHLPVVFAASLPNRAYGESSTIVDQLNLN